MRWKVNEKLYVEKCGLLLWSFLLKKGFLHDKKLENRKEGDNVT